MLPELPVEWLRRINILSFTVVGAFALLLTSQMLEAKFHLRHSRKVLAGLAVAMLAAGLVIFVSGWVPNSWVISIYLVLFFPPYLYVTALLVYAIGRGSRVAPWLIFSGIGGIAAAVVGQTAIGGVLCMVGLLIAALGHKQSKNVNGGVEAEALEIQLGRVGELFDTHDLTRSRRAAEESLAESRAEWRSIAGTAGRVGARWTGRVVERLVVALEPLVARRARVCRAHARPGVVDGLRHRLHPPRPCVMG